MSKEPDVFYERRGRGAADAPAIVFLHGLGSCADDWASQVPAFEGDHRLVLVDLPGHYRSPLPADRLTIDAMADAVAALLRGLGEPPAHVVGLSLGGYVAMELAHHRPELVGGLVLSGCSFNFRGPAGWFIKLLSIMARRGWVKPSRAQMEKKIQRLFPADLADGAEAQLRAGVYPEPVGPAYGEIAGKDFRSSLAAFPRPTSR